MFVLGSLCCSAILFSSVITVDAYWWPVFLAHVWPGMMTHVYTTAMARRYVSTRGRASQLPSSQTLSGSIGPASIFALLALFDWRSLWIGLPIVAFCIQAFLTLPSAQDGEGREGLTSDNHALKKNQSHNGNGGDPSSARSSILAGLIWLAAVPCFV